MLGHAPTPPLPASTRLCSGGKLRFLVCDISVGGGWTWCYTKAPALFEHIRQTHSVHVMVCLGMFKHVSSRRTPTLHMPGLAHPLRRRAKRSRMLGYAWVCSSTPSGLAHADASACQGMPAYDKARPPQRPPGLAHPLCGRAKRIGCCGQAKLDARVGMAEYARICSSTSPTPQMLGCA